MKIAVVCANGKAEQLISKEAVQRRQRGNLQSLRVLKDSGESFRTAANYFHAITIPSGKLPGMES